MLDLLKELCLIDGTSGREDDVRNFIISKIEGKCEYRVDPMGNILAFKKGKKTPKNKVMLTAHMDEVALIVTEITESGFLKFSAVGGIDSKVICGRTVSFSQNENPIRGVIGLKPVHLCEGEEHVKAPSVDKLAIDIGAKDKEEAEKYVSLGDCAYFVSPFVEFGDKKICSKAIDDRFGCATLIRMIERENEFDLHFAFLVQEEVGLRGAGAAAFSVRPDYAIVLEATTASDIAGVSGAKKVCSLGEGAVVSFMDRTTAYDRKLFKKAFELAGKKKIKIQTKTVVAGGNDAGAIHKSVGGVKALTVSLPCRYIHSGASVACTDDMESCFDLAVALSEEFCDD